MNELERKPLTKPRFSADFDDIHWFTSGISISDDCV
jgi:hypothetical protein